MKDAEHFVEKVIRKHIERSKISDELIRKEPITLENYRQAVTDLLGLRVLHLFKEDWLPIHEFISSTWELVGSPVANVREGDADEVIHTFSEHGCTIHKHPKGYRSIHYIVRVQLGKEPVVAEVQVRTIFEEAWSEIDHAIRYPYGADPLVSQYLVMFNRLAGSADEMGSYVQHLNGTLQNMRAEQNRQLTEWEREKAESRAALEKLKTLAEHSESLGKEKAEMQKQIKELQQSIDSLTKPMSSPLLSHTSFSSSLLGALFAGQTKHTWVVDPPEIKVGALITQGPVVVPTAQVQPSRSGSEGATPNTPTAPSRAVPQIPSATKTPPSQKATARQTDEKAPKKG